MAVELYDEHEQSERVRGWLRENGASIVIGVVLALVGIFGWRQWQDYQAERASLADQYSTAIQQEIQAGNLDAADQQWQAMFEGVGEHFSWALAGMQLAAARAEAGNIEAAATIYDRLAADARWPALAPLIDLRMALIDLGRGNAEAALARLAGEPAEGYQGLWLETRGDVLFELGRLAEAEQAYAEAVAQLRGAGRDFRQAETKLAAVRSRVMAQEPIASEPVAGQPVAEEPVADEPTAEEPS